MKKITSLFAKIAIIAAIGTPVLVFAQSAVQPGQSEFGGASVGPQYTLLEPLPCISSTGNTCAPGTVTKTTSIQNYVLYIFKIGIALAVLLTVIMTIWGGFQYMTVESVTGKSDAKDTIKNALLGLFGALASFLILYTINPQLVNLSLLKVPQLNLDTSDHDFLNAVGESVRSTSDQYDQLASTTETQANNDCATAQEMEYNQTATPQEIKAANDKCVQSEATAQQAHGAAVAQRVIGQIQVIQATALRDRTTNTSHSLSGGSNSASNHAAIQTQLTNLDATYQKGLSDMQPFNDPDDVARIATDYRLAKQAITDYDKTL